MKDTAGKAICYAHVSTEKLPIQHKKIVRKECTAVNISDNKRQVYVNLLRNSERKFLVSNRHQDLTYCSPRLPAKLAALTPKEAAFNAFSGLSAAHWNAAEAASLRFLFDCHFVFFVFVFGRGTNRNSF